MPLTTLLLLLLLHARAFTAAAANVGTWRRRMHRGLRSVVQRSNRTAAAAAVQQACHW
jgi:hypothetical protein